MTKEMEEVRRRTTACRGYERLGAFDVDMMSVSPAASSEMRTQTRIVAGSADPGSGVMPRLSIMDCRMRK